MWAFWNEQFYGNEETDVRHVQLSKTSDEFRLCLVRYLNLNKNSKELKLN